VEAGEPAKAALTIVSDVQIRIATASDAEAMARLIDELGYPVTAEEVESRLGDIEGAGHCALLAEIDGRVVGCLTTSMTLVLHRPAPVGRISLMVVDEAFRSRGIGAQMVAAAERLLAEKGCQLVEVTSNLRRNDAHRFWERNGFERTSARFAKQVRD
jgi:GNAT superfamily N-acetyltransferase